MIFEIFSKLKLDFEKIRKIRKRVQAQHHSLTVLKFNFKRPYYYMEVIEGNVEKNKKKNTVNDYKRAPFLKKFCDSQ